MGVAHIGPIVISEKKKPPDRKIKEILRLCMNINGMSDSIDKNMHTGTMGLRALRRLLVRLSILSVTMPPSVSPSTPARKTHDANNVDWLRSRREFAYLQDEHRFAGRDAIIVANATRPDWLEKVKDRFVRVEPLEDVILTRGGQPAVTLRIGRGVRLKSPP